MLLYRVFPYLPSASPGEPGHPLYEHRPQHGGRIDHPDYYVWYLSRNAEAACGEVFGNRSDWTSPELFENTPVSGARRALGVYSLPDDLGVLDLDDPAELLRLGIRPTQVVTRNRAVTQAWGRRIWDDRKPEAPHEHRWDAVQWWSYHRPSWTVLASWRRPELHYIQALSSHHPAMTEAATALNRALTARRGPQPVRPRHKRE